MDVFLAAVSDVLVYLMMNKNSLRRMLSCLSKRLASPQPQKKRMMIKNVGTKVFLANTDG